MKVQIFVDGYLVDTQIVSRASLTDQSSLREVKKRALSASLEHSNISIKDSLRSKLVLIDDDDRPIAES